jgi:hypothetical protein
MIHRLCRERGRRGGRSWHGRHRRSAACYSVGREVGGSRGEWRDLRRDLRFAQVLVAHQLHLEHVGAERHLEAIRRQLLHIDDIFRAVDRDSISSHGLCP